MEEVKELVEKVTMLQNVSNEYGSDSIRDIINTLKNKIADYFISNS